MSLSGSSIKSRKAKGFHSPRVFHKVMKVLEGHHFRLPVLRFVIDLFDKSVMRRIVYEEDGEEEQDGDDVDDDSQREESTILP